MPGMARSSRRVLGPETGKSLVSELRGTVNVWDAETGGPRRTRIVAFPGPGRLLAFSPDGKQLASSVYNASPLSKARC